MGSKEQSYSNYLHSTTKGFPGRGKRLGKGGGKSHRKVLRGNIQIIAKHEIRRSARRGGLKRIPGLVYGKRRKSRNAPDKKIGHEFSTGRRISPRRYPNNNKNCEALMEMRDKSKSDLILQEGTQKTLETNAVAVSSSSTGKTRSGRRQMEMNGDTPITEVKKQKLPPLPKRPENVPHFYNKVVKWKDTSDLIFYFVLHFDTEKMLLKLCPLYRQGIFIGKRSGRTRWKLQVDSKIFLVKAEKFEIVSTQMVAKTPFVANETWDILD